MTIVRRVELARKQAAAIGSAQEGERSALRTHHDWLAQPMFENVRADNTAHGRDWNGQGKIFYKFAQIPAGFWLSCDGFNGSNFRVKHVGGSRDDVDISLDPPVNSIAIGAPTVVKPRRTEPFPRSAP